MKHIQSFQLFESNSYDLKSADLKADFAMLNDMLFDGKVQLVPLRWMRTKYKLGVMAYTEDNQIEYVGISTMYKLTRQQYLNVLAHEMIHVYMEQFGIYEKDPHGRKFMGILDDLNKKNPDFQIAKSENAADFNVADSGGDKTYGVVLFNEDGNLSIVAVQEKALDDIKALDEFVDGLKGQATGAFLRSKSVIIEVYRSSHPDIPKFKIKKSLSLRSMQLYVIDEKLASEIRTDELVRTDKVK